MAVNNEATSAKKKKQAVKEADEAIGKTAPMMVVKSQLDMMQRLESLARVRKGNISGIKIQQTGPQLKAKLTI